MEFFLETIIEPILEILQVQSIVEIVTDQGKSTKKLAEYCQINNKRLHIVDPNPKYDTKVWKNQYGDAIEFYLGLSLNMIPLIDEYELVLIDGDHNWYTVYNELKLIEKRAIRQQLSFPIVILHNIGWPYGRRDLYYNPSNIPDFYRQPYQQRGMIVDSPELQNTGGLNAHLNNAIYENNLRNGVLTAIEDFLQDTDQNLNFYKVLGFHGLGIIVDRNLIANSQSLAEFLETLNCSGTIKKHIEKLEAERNRIKLQNQNSYQKGLEKQAKENDRLKKSLEQTEKELQEYKNKNFNQLNSIEKLLTWVEQLEDLIEAMLSANRWKIGNFLYLVYRKTLRKSLDTSPEFLLDQIQKSIERWKENNFTYQPYSVSKNKRDKSNYQAMSLDINSFRIDVVVCVHNALSEVQLCLESILRNTKSWNYTLYIVNDGSEEKTSEYLRKWILDKPHCKLLENETAQGYTKAANKGIKETTSDCVILLNSDTIVPNQWLETLIQCSESDSKIGIVSPLSNAASWQSIPEIPNGNTWAINDLPSGYTVDNMAKLVRLVSKYQFPRVPFLNGFCLCIKRTVIDQIGYLDEQAFPQGYGEENDYCLRALNAGFELAIADQTYIYHAKSKSYGNERRLKLAKAGSKALAEKHGQEKIDQCLKIMKYTTTLTEIRARIKEGLANNLGVESELNHRKPRILFLLPVKGGGGGCHSVVQEVQGMNQLGIKVQIAIPSKYRFNYLNNYPSLKEKENIFYFYDDHQALIQESFNFEIIIATIYTSVKILKEILTKNSTVLPAYYIQDYEPWFCEKETPNWEIAYQSYTAIPNLLLFAKTEWLCNLVKTEHNVIVNKVKPSLDQNLYFPDLGKEKSDQTTRIVAMVRPSTPRRGAKRTMKVLKRIKEQFAEKVMITIFGCYDEDLEAYDLETKFEFTNQGILTREKVATLLRECDLFVDFSDYQAFGRTGLEAMACGCAVILPEKGGATEYAVDKKNAILVNTKSEEECYLKLFNLISNPKLQIELCEQAITTAEEYSIRKAAISELQLLKNAWLKQQE